MDYEVAASEIDAISSQSAHIPLLTSNNPELVRALVVQLAVSGAATICQDGSINWSDLLKLLRDAIHKIERSPVSALQSSKRDLPNDFPPDVGKVFDRWHAREKLTGSSTVVGFLEGLGSAVYDNGEAFATDSMDIQEFAKILYSAMLLE